MIDELSHRLDSLAATVDDSVDLVALHRSIARRNRWHAAARVGFAATGVLVVVGGLVAVRDIQSPPTDGPAATTDQAATSTTSAAPLADCSTLLTAQRANTSTALANALGTDAGVAVAANLKGSVADPANDASTSPPVDFKGVASILAVDGTTLTVSVIDATSGSSGTRTVIVDPLTEWRDGPTSLAAPAPLHTGDKVTLATVAGADGVDHALAVDLVVPPTQAAPDETAADTAKRGESVVLSGPSLVPGPTTKATGTITATTDASITVALHGDEEGKIVIADIATATFYVDATVCRPSGLTVGEPVGVAFHLDATSAVVADAILLMP